MRLVLPPSKQVWKQNVRATPKNPSFRRAFYTREWRGQLVVSKRPPPRLVKNFPNLKEWQRWMTATAYAWKYLPPRVKFDYIEMLKGVWLQPRDLFVMNMRGTAFWVEFEDGRRLYPVTAVERVSEVLDILGYTPGLLIVRGPDRWESLEPGPDGWVLTARGPDALPEWSPLPTPAVSATPTKQFANSLRGSATQLVVSYNFITLNLPYNANAYLFAYFEPVSGNVTYRPLIELLYQTGTQRGNVMWRFQYYTVATNGQSTLTYEDDLVVPDGPIDRLTTVQAPRARTLSGTARAHLVRLWRLGANTQDTSGYNSLVVSVSWTG